MKRAFSPNKIDNWSQLQMGWVLCATLDKLYWVYFNEDIAK